MLTINPFALLLYALVGAAILFGCFQAWRWLHRRYPNLNLFFLNLPFLKSLFAPRPLSIHRLTQRELEIALLAAQGQRVSEIAQQLTISPLTVETHIKKIYKKLRCTSRQQLGRTLESLGYSPDHPGDADLVPGASTREQKG